METKNSKYIHKSLYASKYTNSPSNSNSKLIKSSTANTRMLKEYIIHINSQENTRTYQSSCLIHEERKILPTFAFKVVLC